MKRNPQDRYVVSEDPMFIEDADTGTRLMFLIDRENNLVFRSMLEEDIKPVMARCSITSKEKREKTRMLREFLSKEGSQEYFFVIEEINPIDYNGDHFKSEEWDWIYGYPRVPIGFGARVQTEEVYVTKKLEEYIDTTIFNSYENRLDKVLKLIEIAGKCFGIDGKTWVLPAQ